MRIKVYGVLRDYFGTGLELRLGENGEDGNGEGISCKEVLEILIKREPKVLEHVSSLRVIKGKRLVEDGEEIIEESDELLLFPPSSGG